MWLRHDVAAKAANDVRRWRNSPLRHPSGATSPEGRGMGTAKHCGRTRTPVGRGLAPAVIIKHLYFTKNRAVLPMKIKIVGLFFQRQRNEIMAKLGKLLVLTATAAAVGAGAAMLYKKYKEQECDFDEFDDFDDDDFDDIFDDADSEREYTTISADVEEADEAVEEADEAVEEADDKETK